MSMFELAGMLLSPVADRLSRLGVKVGLRPRPVSLPLTSPILVQLNTSQSY
ncbi:MAG: hypothetical protein HC769_01995 [Cyanobacteria bacterium CRU_2_1]|nr:hypothetical protein [Cyanobacteria bacterium CRU_2_1]